MDRGTNKDKIAYLYGDVNDPILWRQYSLEPDHNYYRHLPDSHVGENLFKKDWDEWKEKEKAEKLRLEQWRAKEKEHQQDEAFARKESENHDG